MIAQQEVTQALALDLVRLDGGTQPRAQIDGDVVTDYAQQMLEGAVFPPLVIYYDGAEYWLADGFHRYHAAKQICRETISVDIKQGTRRDAVLYSVSANAQHGLRRSNADKKRAVETLLRDEEWQKWSDREIARQCNVDHKTVASLRIIYLGNSPDSRMVERNGTIYGMNTANIGYGISPLYSVSQGLPTPYYTIPVDAPEYPTERVPLAEVYAPDPVVEAKEKRDAHVMQVMGSSESPEWYTPQEIVQLSIELLGEIDLDPCSNSHETPNVPAKTLYTKEDDGLAYTWYGKVYLNPPYGSEIPQWIEKLVKSYGHGVTEAIALLPARIDTQWFQALYQFPMCNVRGRLQFENASNSAPFPSVIVYLGKRVEDFIKVFKDRGPIMRRIG